MYYTLVEQHYDGTFKNLTESTKITSIFKLVRFLDNLEQSPSIYKAYVLECKGYCMFMKLFKYDGEYCLFNYFPKKDTCKSFSYKNKYKLVKKLMSLCND